MQLREFERKAQKLAKGNICVISFSRVKVSGGFKYRELYMHSESFPTKCILANNFDEALAILAKMEFPDDKRTN